MDCAHFDHEIVSSWEFLVSQWVRALELHTVHRAKYFSATIQLLSETDICWDQLQLVPAACDLKPLPLTCRGLTRSSGSIHLLLIPCRHQSLNADTYATLACTYTPSAGPAVQTVHRSLLGLSERNDYHTSVSTSLSLCLPCPYLLLKQWHLLTAALVALCKCRLWADVCARFRVYVIPPFMCIWYVNSSWSISSSQLNRNHSPYRLCHSRNSLDWTVFSPPQRVVTPTRGRCCPSSALPRGSVFLEWHVWLSTATTSEWCQREPH